MRVTSVLVPSASWPVTRSICGPSAATTTEMRKPRPVPGWGRRAGVVEVVDVDDHVGKPSACLTLERGHCIVLRYIDGRVDTE